jgi:cellulose synthase/poly-beta-1,6-N-acetylglucosamine synthase-like glycosyltransferase
MGRSDPKTGLTGEAPNATDEFYVSVDSAPVSLSVKRSRSVTDGFLIAFAALTVLTLSGVTYVNSIAPGTFPTDLIFFTADRANAILPIRLFFVLFFVLYTVYAHGSFLAKLKLGLGLLFKLIAVCALIDASAWVAWSQANSIWPVHVQQIMAGLAGLAIFPHTVLSQARLPAPSGAPIRRRGRVYEYWLFIIPTIIAALAAVVISSLYDVELENMRNIAILGGMGPGVFLAQQILTLQLGVFGLLRNALSRRRRFSPPIAVLIPAHNESHLIEATIAAVDRASEEYKGNVRILVANNCSTDNTSRLALAAIEQCKHAKGIVFDSKVPGKAKALNDGLGRIDEEFIVRIDADTQIEPKALRIAMRHFASKTVGAVGGLPLPFKNTGLLGKLRSIEVICRHGFFQLAIGAFNGILGIPGMFVIYRRDALMEAGGIAEEMNGEDTDIVLRITNLGYRAVSDPRAVFRTEVPEDLTHLREQRTRWFRSLYHITAHNRAMLFKGNLITGALVLPFTLLNGARRAMMAPLLIYGAVMVLIFGGVFEHPNLTTVLAVLVGMPFLMACTILTLWRRMDLIGYMPAYMGFRLLRSYYTLGATLTLIYPKRAGERAFDTPKPLAEWTSKSSEKAD